MKRLFIKSVCIILTVILSSSALAACTKKVSVTSQITLTYWTNLNNSLVGVVSDLGQLKMYEELENRTNIKVKFKHPPAGQDKEQFNLMIASRDLPDIIEYDWLQYPGGPSKAIQDNVIIKLNQIIDEKAPNLKKVLKENPNVKKQVETFDDSLYVFPSLGLDKLKTFDGLIIRKDWLDDLNLSVPETMDEWTAVLKAFKEKKGATAPITLNPWMMNSREIFNGAFNVGINFYIDNGKVKYGPYEPAFKEYLEYMYNWYKEGLLDPDVAVNDEKTMEAKILSGKSGARYGYIGGTIGKCLQVKQDAQFDLVAAQYPVLRKGDAPNFVVRKWEYRGEGSAAITSANKYPEESAKWLDYLYGEEGNMLKNFGIEGLTYTMKDRQPKYTDLITNNPDGLTISQTMSNYFRANYPSPGLSDDRYLEQYYTFPQQTEAAKLWSKYADNALQVTYPSVSLLPEEAEEMVSIMAEVKTYQEEMFFKFIMGVEPLAKFNDYIDQIDKMGIKRAIEIKQKALERYNQQ